MTSQQTMITTTAMLKSSNTSFIGDYNEGNEQEEIGLLSQEPGRPRGSQDPATTQTSNDDITGTEQGQASNEEEMETPQGDNNHGDQLSEESGSETKGIQKESQHEAGVEATTSPTDPEHASQPARTARTLRSRRDIHKGSPHSQSTHCAFSLENAIQRPSQEQPGMKRGYAKQLCQYL